MTLNFYTLGVLYLVYSFLGWVGETVVATFRGQAGLQTAAWRRGRSALCMAQRPS